jgi:class 3 adenylate cyclase
LEHDDLAEKLSMTEIIRLQDTLSKALVRRFEKRVALAFSDVAGSTVYFSKYGDEAGRKLQQRHLDLVSRALKASGGRVVDTAGDGAFLCFPALNAAVKAMVELQRQISIDNDSRPAEHRLQVRVGAHFGPVLTDDTLVSGDAVNFCSRVAGSAGLSEIRLSVAAYQELSDVALRLRCRKLKGVTLKGVAEPVELVLLDWLDPAIFPASVRIDSATVLKLPARDLIRFGRLREQDGEAANDIVLEAPDPGSSNRISRWHFELHRRSTGFTLRNVSSSLTDVNGVAVQKGGEAEIRPGTKVRVGGVLTLEFLGDKSAPHDATYVPDQ